MLVRSPGVSICWVRLIIVTNIVFFFQTLELQANNFDKQIPSNSLRILQEAKIISGLDNELAQKIADRCNLETICIAQEIVKELGNYANLTRIEPKSSNQRRLAEVLPSVKKSYKMSDESIFIELKHFGRKAEWEVINLLEGSNKVVFDLTENEGGDLSRMIRVASLFIGPVKKAFVVRSQNLVTHFDIPSPVYSMSDMNIVLMVGQKTASSAELFSALLRQYAGAKLVGEKTRGKDWLLKVVPVNDKFWLSIPAGQIFVPGEKIVDGILPDEKH